MKRITSSFLFLLLGSNLLAQSVQTPDKIYGDLFVDVQMNKIFPDGKTFVDCIPKGEPEVIVADYHKIKNNPAIKFSLKMFVEENFTIPVSPTSTYKSDTSANVKFHIEKLWDVLQRNPDAVVKGSSLLPLPNSYIVPGGRFREINYGDSYFTMLGLQESKKFDMMENMIKNFAYLIENYGHIPNGNRTYYLSRSQPPFFASMVGLLAESKGEDIYETYLPALEKEYIYWMRSDKKQLNTALADNYAVKVGGYIVNRYWDSLSIPRQESYRDDVETAMKTKRNKQVVYRNLRAGATSGWDFSSRWFVDAKTLSTIQTIDIAPVDLNSLLFNLEYTLYTIYKKKGLSDKASVYKQAFTNRAKFINQYCWNKQDGCYYDYNFKTKKQVKTPTLAMAYPLFFKIASQEQANKVAAKLKKDFLKPGGLTTTLNRTGQQWDAPNGWAPLQWMAIQGVENYKQHALAREIGSRWINLNVKVFKNTGKLMEKYNVMDTHLEAGGGEYPSQDGFGWTNGVLLKLMNKYQMGIDF